MALAQAGGEPVVEAEAAADGATHVLASIRIRAPASIVWGLLTQCGTGAAIIPHLESCVVVERDPRGLWDVRDHVVNPPLLPRIRTRVRNDFIPERRLAFRLLGGDLKRSDGAWTLTPDGDGVKLAYEARVELGFAAPQMLVRGAIRSDFLTMLANLRREAEARAR